MALYSFEKDSPNGPEAQVWPSFSKDLLPTFHLPGRQCVTISREDIEKVAVLARIRVDDEQVSALEKDLGNILDLVDQLAAADTDSVEPMAHPLNAVQRLRADEVTETNQREAFQAIAPATENGLYLVPRVIE
jgi:aspartyl-tRNA(Asn)/glutamyl-tRNA(Gln) amidotransferase subunit C|tara:strand:- start:3059 stop:3457 length:399 start_codon:yes stop_codon:yes gene_type:complete